MSANIRIIHAQEFIKANPEGQLNLDESTKMLIEIASVSAPLTDYGIILDTRKMQSRMSEADLWFLASELNNYFSKAFSWAQKTAVLCPLEEFDNAKFFALCAKNRGFRVKAFTSFEEAYE